MLFSLFLITTICNEEGMFFEFTYKTDLGIKETGVWGVVVEQQNKLFGFWSRISFFFLPTDN